MSAGTCVRCRDWTPIVDAIELGTQHRRNLRQTRLTLGLAEHPSARKERRVTCSHSYLGLGHDESVACTVSRAAIRLPPLYELTDLFETVENGS